MASGKGTDGREDGSKDVGEIWEAILEGESEPKEDIVAESEDIGRKAMPLGRSSAAAKRRET